MRRAWPVAATGPSAKGMKQESPRLRSGVAGGAGRRVQGPARQSTMRGPVPGSASDGTGGASDGTGGASDGTGGASDGVGAAAARLAEKAPGGPEKAPAGPEE